MENYNGEQIEEPKVMVTLFGVGVGEKAFEIGHAQSILNLKTRPLVWKLKDSKYTFKDGKIIEVAGNTAP